MFTTILQDSYCVADSCVWLYKLISLSSVLWSIFYPVHVCAAGLCVYVCLPVYVYNYVAKNRLFGVLPLEKSTALSLSITAKKGLTMLGDLFKERNLEAFY